MAEREGRRKKTEIQAELQKHKYRRAQLQRKRSSTQAKGKRLRRNASFCTRSARFLLPQNDTERKAYGAKEAILAKEIGKAIDAPREMQISMKDYRNSKRPGHFPLTVHWVAQRYMDDNPTSNATLGDVDAALDEIANNQIASENSQMSRSDAIFTALRRICDKISPDDLFWIVNIILKQLRVGMSERSIFDDFHYQAWELFNICCDLRKVVRTLIAHYQRDGPGLEYRMRNIQVGDMVRAQCAQRVESFNEMHKCMMHSIPYVVETKFDGERIQLHFDSHTGRVNYYTRNLRDRQFNSFDTLLPQFLSAEGCILDGEMVVWNCAREAFEAFGSLLSTMLAANNTAGYEDKDGRLRLDRDVRPSDDSQERPLVDDLCVVYIAFDILHDGKQDVRALSLQERHERLLKVIKVAPDQQSFIGFGKRELGGKIMRLIPNETAYSTYAKQESHLRDQMEEVMDRHEEGIVAKSLTAAWTPNERKSHVWSKIKPDYVENLDIDAALLGMRKGTGNVRGGRVSEFVVGVARMPPGTNQPKKFISFARVGTGLSEDDRDLIFDTLDRKEALRKVEHGTPRPEWMRLSKDPCVSEDEKVDYWVVNMQDTIILELLADLRLWQSTSFACKYSLRFPRIHQIRWDKDWCTASTEGYIHEQANKDMQNLGAYVTNKRRKAKSGPPKRKRDVDQSLKSGAVNTTEMIGGPFEGIFAFIASELVQDHQLRKKLQRGFQQMGGIPKTECGETTTIIIADRHERSLKNLDIYKGRQWDILSSEWLNHCVDARRYLPPLQEDYVAASDKGPSCKGSYTAKSIEALLQQTPKSSVEIPKHALQKRFNELKQQSDMFRNCVMTLVPSPQMKVSSKSKDSWAYQVERIRAKIRFYGGSVLDHFSQDVTHFVIAVPLARQLSVHGSDQRLHEEASQFIESEGTARSWALKWGTKAKLPVLTSKWVTECISRGTYIPPEESRFHVSLSFFEKQRLQRRANSDEFN